MSWISHWTSLPSNHASDKPPLNRKHLGISRFRAEDHILSGRCCGPGRSLTHVRWTWEFLVTECDKEKDNTKSNQTYLEGWISEEKKQNKKPPGPSCRGEFSAIQTNKPNDYEWCKSVTYTPRLQLDRWGPPGTLWSFHPDPCKNPPNMSKFHLQVFSFESLVTKLKRDDFFGGFRIVFDTTMEWIPPFPLCLMVVLLFGSFHPPFRQKDHGGILTTKIPFWKTNM